MLPDRPPALTAGERALLAAVLAVGALLRVLNAGRTPLWFDELYTADQVSRPFGATWDVIVRDVHPPLHAVLCWLWYRAWPSDLGVRMLPVVCGVIGLAVTFALVRRAFGRTAGWLALVILAVHPWHLFVSQDGRQYGLLTLALGAATWGAWHLHESGSRRDGARYAIAAAIALWTHYLAAVPLFTIFLWGVVTTRREIERRRAWGWAHAATGLLFSPLLPLWWRQAHQLQADHWMPRPDAAEFLDVARHLAFTATYLVPVAAVVVAVPFANPRTRGAAALLACASLVPVALCGALGLAGLRLFVPRYMVFAVPGFVGLVASGLAALPGRRTAWVAGALVVLLSSRAALRGSLHPEAHALALALPGLRAHVAPGDAIFTDETHAWFFARRYFPRHPAALILDGRTVPYYDGGLLVPANVDAGSDSLRRVAARGDGWWALRIARAGRPPSSVALFDSLAGAPSETLEALRIWHGAVRR